MTHPLTDEVCRQIADTEDQEDPKRVFGIEMSKSTAEEFAELAKDCGVSYAELIRKAMQTFKALYDEQKDGGEVLITTADGVTQTLITLGPIQEDLV